MGFKKKVVPTAEPGFVDEEGRGQAGDEEDSGRGLLVAVSNHVVNDEDEDEEDEEEDSEAPKQSECF